MRTALLWLVVLPSEEPCGLRRVLSLASGGNPAGTNARSSLVMPALPIALTLLELEVATRAMRVTSQGSLVACAMSCGLVLVWLARQRWWSYAVHLGTLMVAGMTVNLGSAVIILAAGQLLMLGVLGPGQRTHARRPVVVDLPAVVLIALLAAASADIVGREIGVLQPLVPLRNALSLLGVEPPS